MNTIIKQISGCVFIFAMMFVLLQSTQTNLHARTRGPVVVKPYDEESKKMIKEELRQIGTNNESLNKDLKSLKDAAETYSEAPKLNFPGKKSAKSFVKNCRGIN